MYVIYIYIQFELLLPQPVKFVQVSKALEIHRKPMKFHKTQTNNGTPKKKREVKNKRTEGGMPCTTYVICVSIVYVREC